MDAIFENAISVRIDGLRLRIIDIKDLLANKQKIQRSSEKGLVDQQGILARRRILKTRRAWFVQAITLMQNLPQIILYLLCLENLHKRESRGPFGKQGFHLSPYRSK